jgi:hypothetical protein
VSEADGGGKPEREDGPDRRQLSLAAAGVLTGLGIILLCGLAAIGTGGTPLVGGLMMGTLFGQVSLAAAWVALGPLRMIVRLTLSGLWLVALWLSLAIGAAASGAQPTEMLVLVGGILLQWILVQIGPWILAAFCGLRITHRSELGKLQLSDQQFGIRQLLILTAIVAVLLGGTRFLLTRFQWAQTQPDWAEGLKIFSFLAVANAVLTLPLLAAGLLRRHAVIASIVAVGFALALVAVEYPAFTLIARGGPPAEELIAIFLWMNATQCAWVLTIVGILRAGGFRLFTAASL